MKNVAIVIPNRNGYKALPLCIESIRARTEYPHKIIVYDDNSSYKENGQVKQNLVDLDYLRKCKDKGWIELYEGKKAVKHGGALNFLLNERCKDEFDYAMVVDNDLHIIESGWLRAMIEEAEKDEMILAVCDHKAKGYCPGGYRPALYFFWFGLINLSAYRDGMQVDWSQRKADRREEPYKTEFADLYPPEKNELWQFYMKNGNKQLWNKVTFDRNLVKFDPGCTFDIKLKYFNPKGYKAVPVPGIARIAYVHYEHCSHFLDPHNKLEGKDAMKRDEKISSIKAELERLRCQN